MKYQEYRKKLNNRLKIYKSTDHDEKKTKFKKEQEKKNQNNKKVINKNLSIKSKVNKYNSFPKRKQKKNQIRVSKTEKENNITDSEEKNKYLNSSLSNNKSNNNKSYFKYSFYNLFDINNNRNYSSYRKNNKKSNKKILQRFIENGQKENKKESTKNEKQKSNNYNNIKYIMPKINVTSKQHTPKSNTIFTTQSSRFLIKKINSTNFRNRNSNSLFNIQNNLIDTHDNFSSRLFNSQNSNYYNNDLPGIVNNINIEHPHLHRNERNHHKYDKHFGNEHNCPKCQSMDMKFNYLKEKKNERIPNINSHYADNNFNKTLDSFKKHNIIIPMNYYGKLYLRNYYNYRNNSINFLKKLHKNNSVVHIKKINVNKYSDQILV